MPDAPHAPALIPARARIVLGAMSGTSADGVDVAAAEITGRGLAMQVKYLGHVEHAYDAELRKRIFAIRESGSCGLEELARLGRDITLAYAEATRALMEQMSLRPSQIAALAAHGQTLFHAPPDSIQWLDPSLLAARTDLAVVSDLRRADLAAGGQGAPLVPFADWILFRHPEKTRVILNLGGIANLTYLPAGGGIEDVIAFDTGPGCCLSDWIARTRCGVDFDAGGELALQGWGGVVIAMEWMEQQAYPGIRPPKSTDVPEVLAAYASFRSGRDDVATFSAADELSAAAALVGISVVEQLIVYTSPHVRDGEFLVAGGGARNAAIVAHIAKSLTTYKTGYRAPTSLDEYGIPSQAREAVAFAVLGAATLDGEPSNVPSVTGAARRVVLGSVTPRQSS